MAEPQTSGPPRVEPSGDRRIAEIRALLDSGRYDLLSLDVFDTLVWRKTPVPADVHYLTGRRLLASGFLHDSSSPESFARERVGAEERARRKHPPGEVTLAEIYEEFPIGYMRGCRREDLVAAELDTEQGLVRIDDEMAGLLAHARALGMKTALVSDTYFDSDQIRRLIGPEVAGAVDHTILSCERRLSKYLGLHRALLEAGNVEAARVLHVGDNYAADVEGPAVLGLERYWYRKFSEAFDEMIRAELPQSASRRAAFFAGDDCGMTALRSRAVARHADPYEQWGAAILGPVVNGFCDWVVEKCEALSITMVLCLMREGRILKSLLDTRGAGLETHELFVSRYSALKASIYEGTEEEIRRFVFRPSPQSAPRILDQLGLARAGLPEAKRLEPLEPVETLALIKRIAHDRTLRKAVAASSAEARRNLLRHLDLLVDPRRERPVAFVDLGYKGTIQECLQLIMNREGLGMRTHGLYLVTGGDVHTTQSRGAVVEGWLAENGQPISMAHTFMRSPEIVEQSLMASCGTTLGHDAEGKPVLDRIRISETQREQIERIQTGIKSYGDLWVRLGGGLRNGEGGGSSTRMKRWYQEICARMVARPTEAELELFGEWQHDENFGSAKARRLATVLDLDEWEHTHMSAHQLASLPFARVYWPFGFAHRISPRMGDAVAHIYLRTVEPDTFDAVGPANPIVFYWDGGSGFNQNSARMDTYRLNNRGRVWKRFTLELKHGRLRAIGFSVGLPGEILRLAGCLLRVHPHGAMETLTRHPHEFIEKCGYAHLAGNLYEVREDPALLVIPIEGVEDFTGAVHADLFFSVTPGA